MARGCDYLQSSASWIAFHLQSDMGEADLYLRLGSAAQLARLFLSVSLPARQHATDLIKFRMLVSLPRPALASSQAHLMLFLWPGFHPPLQSEDIKGRQHEKKRLEIERKKNVINE